jgi:hypothetical protein
MLSLLWAKMPVLVLKSSFGCKNSNLQKISCSVVSKDEALENNGEVVSEDLCRRDCKVQLVLLGGNLVNQEIFENIRNWRKFKSGLSSSGNFQIFK